MRKHALFLFYLAASQMAADTENWLQYRGANSDGLGEVHRWMLYRLDFETGKILWEFESHQGIPPQMRHPRNSFASETPVTDGERVYEQS
jgi:uncharacterized Zn finger protein